MRKIAVFARGLMMSACVLLTMTACSEEELVAPEENGGADNNTTITTPTDVPMKTIRISAGMAQGEGGEMARTTLNGTKVLWDENDKYSIAYGSNDLTVVLNKKESGLAVKTDKSTGTNVQVKYSGIKVFYNGEDIAKSLISTNLSDGKDNQYKIGITYKSTGVYKLSEPGVAIDTQVKGGRNGYQTGIQLIRVSSSSSFDFSNNNKVTVVISDPQYREGTSGNWITVNSTTNIINGSAWNAPNDVESWSFQSGYELTLDDTPGQTYGVFSGKVPEYLEVDGNTRAVFPKDALQSYTGGNLIIDIPETQEYVENSFDHKANIMVGDVKVADNGDYDATFSNMMSTIAIPLTGDNDFISEITLTDKGGKLWGTATIAANDYIAGISTNSITSDGGGNTIKMICKEPVELTSEAKTFYFVVPVGAFAKGMDVKVTTVDKRQMTKSASTLSVERNKLIKLPTLAGDFPTYEHNVENSVLKGYLDKGAYSSWGSGTRFTTSSANNNLKTNCVDKDYPNYYKVEWNGEANTTYNITFTDITANKTFEYTTTDSCSYNLMNMVPGHEYKYVVNDGSKNLTAGKFKATGRVRMVTVDDVFNFRDLGGWIGLDNKPIKYEWLYRCGSMNGQFNVSPYVGSFTTAQVAAASNYNMFTANSTRQLVEMGIKSELDLRYTSTEVSSKDVNPHKYCIAVPHTNVPNWTYYHINTSPAQDNPRTDAGVVKDVAYIIDQVINHNNPIAFHCMSGADRTGAVAFTILALLGVSEGNIALEYEITNFSHEQKVIYGKSEIRGKYTSQNNTNTFYNDAFKKYANPSTINGVKCTLPNLQQKAYAYLNHTFSHQGKAIKASDLDRFIEKMLGMNAGSYQQPSWATDTNRKSLEEIFDTDQTK